MQGQTLAEMRKRLIRIMDLKIDKLKQSLEDENKQLLMNESLIEEWVNLLQCIISFKNKSIKPIQIDNKKIKTDINYIHLPKPDESSSVSKFLLEISANRMFLYDFSQKKANCIKDELVFSRGMIRKNSSYNFYDQENAIIIGGSRQSNPNLKCKRIFNLNIFKRQLTKIGQLQEGVSSHSSILINQRIYIIGGNRDENVITKLCYQFNIVGKKIEQIASLNYPSASHCLTSWKNQFIYKIGGVGSCFGEFDLSPYIERYSIQRDEWELINPEISNNLTSLANYALLAHSFAYMSNNNIVILGGYNLQMKSFSSACIIQVQSKQISEQSSITSEHSIIAIGNVYNLSEGGFKHSQSIRIANQILLLQSDCNGSTKILKIGTNIGYM